jgi:multidrug efflux pump subunit AcrB
VIAALDKPGTLGPGVRYELGGLYQQQQIAFAGLVRVFGAALVAEFLLLLVLYRRLMLPVIIIGCSLLSTSAVFTALWLCGVDLNITALMGMTMIIGIGTEMAIFYVSEFEAMARHMPPAQAAREASRHRLRPITMTTLAAILTCCRWPWRSARDRASSNRWRSRSSRACCCNIRWCWSRCRSSCA